MAGSGRGRRGCAGTRRAACGQLQVVDVLAPAGQDPAVLDPGDLCPTSLIVPSGLAHPLRGEPYAFDDRLVTGAAADVARQLHVTYLRSPVAHARITAIDVEAARTAPGVVAVFTGEDMKALSNPIAVPMAMGVKVPVFYPLATDRVRFVGDLVAMVVAQTRYEAEDASELIEVTYDPLPAVATYEAALDPRAHRCSTSSTTTSCSPAPTARGTSMPPSRRPTGSSI